MNEEKNNLNLFQILVGTFEFNSYAMVKRVPIDPTAEFELPGK